MIPAKKSDALTRFLDSEFGRTKAIETDHCIPGPIGCGKPIGQFRDVKDIDEYLISGLCQECQDKVFGEDYGE